MVSLIFTVDTLWQLLLTAVVTAVVVMAVMVKTVLFFALVFALPNQATAYASQHYSVLAPSQDKLEGLWQIGHLA